LALSLHPALAFLAAAAAAAASKVSSSLPIIDSGFRPNSSNQASYTRPRDRGLSTVAASCHRLLRRQRARVLGPAVIRLLHEGR
jgi:hypothetical protein